MFKQRLTSLTIIMLTLFWLPGLVRGAPELTSIEGAMASGQTVTITGSGFGFGPTIYKWDDFEGATHVVGNNVGAGPGSFAWTIRNASSNPCKISNAENRGTSTKHARSRWDRTTYNHWTSGIDYIFSGSPSPVYLSFWWRWKDLGSASPNWKPYWPVGYGSKPGEPRISTCYGGPDVQIISPASGEESDKKWSGAPTEDNWLRVEFYGVESDPNQSNGTVIWLEQRSLNGTFSTIFNDNGNVETRNGSTHWDRIVLGDYCDQGTSVDKIVDLDDVYIANSRARVELANRNTWSGMTHREIQPVTAWSSNSIAIKVNQGSFQIGETAYLFVVDENGVVNSQGYPITIQKAFAPPSAPKGLRIVN